MRPPGKRWPGRENRLIRETLAAWAAALRDFPLPALRRSCLWGKSKKDICRGRAQCSGPGSSNKRIRSWLRTIYPYSLESFISIFEYSGCHVVLLYKQRFIPPLCKTGAIGATAHNSYALVLTCEDWRWNAQIIPCGYVEVKSAVPKVRLFKFPGGDHPSSIMRRDQIRGKYHRDC
jgi:hypothetical protein